MSNPAFWQAAVVVLLVAFAIALRFSKNFRGYQFTAWIIAVVAAAMIYPAQFLHVGDFDMRNKWVMLIAIQLVMFGMGTQMSVKDFAGVAKSPRGVFVGIVCHFSVMPLVGLALTKIFRFPPEIAAGVILIGSCSSGLASNVMAFMAKSNLALSVTVTAVTTMIAPIMTPLWMKLLAGTHGRGELFQHDGGDHQDRARADWRGVAARLFETRLAARAKNCLCHRGVCGGVDGVFDFRRLGIFEGAFRGWRADGDCAGRIFVERVCHRRRCITRWRNDCRGWIDIMPTMAIVGILYVTAMTTASGRDNLLKVGALLFRRVDVAQHGGIFLRLLFEPRRRAG